MAIIPVNQYPGKINPISDAYPSGSARNVSVPGAGDGTPLVENWLNDWWGFGYRMLREIGIVPNDTVDTTKVSQFFTAMANIAQAGTHKILIENDSVSPLTKIVAKAGVEWDSTNTIPIALLSNLIKDITAPWVAGDGNGGYASAVPLAINTWYHIFAIKSTELQAPGIVDIAIDADINATQALIVSGYTHFERIGSILTETGSTNIRQFSTTQIGATKKFEWKESLVSGFVNPGDAVGGLIVIFTPPNVSTNAVVRIFFGFSGGPPVADGLIFGRAFSPFKNNLTNLTVDYSISGSFSTGVGDAPSISADISDITTNTSSQIKYGFLSYPGISPLNISFDFETIGWYE